MAGPEEPLERLLDVAPLPPARSAALFLEVGGRTGTFRADAVQDRLRFGAALAGEEPEALPAGPSAIRAGHPPAQQGMQRQRQKRGFMRPVFEQAPLLPASPGRGVDQRTIIGAKAREGGKVMGADQDIDAINLVEGELVDGLKPSRGRDLFRAPASETLGGKSDPPRLGERELFHLRHVAPLAAFRPSSGANSTATAPARISTQPRAPMAVRRSPSRSAPASAANTLSSARMSAASAGGV